MPNGEYKVELYFTEPFTKERRMKVEEQCGADTIGNREFDVKINSITVLKNLNLDEQYGIQRAVKQSFVALAAESNGISIQFVPIKGEAILSGIKLRKL